MFAGMVFFKKFAKYSVGTRNVAHDADRVLLC